jgi:flotillin
VGDKSRRTALAEADAIEGAKRGEAEKARRVAEAQATQAEGEAKAASILAVGQSEASAMEKKAAAFAHYSEAAVLEMLIDVLPKVAKEVAAPLAAIDKLTVISTDGASQVPKQVTNGIVQTMELLENTTGVNLAGLMQRYVGAATNGQATTPEELS